METPAKLFHQLQQTTRIFVKNLNKKLEPHGISSSEWGIIWNLKNRGPMTQASLASFLNIEPPAISNSLTKLQKKNLIIRKTGTNKRERTVFLSEKALTQIPQWESIVSAYRNDVLTHLLKNDQDELYNSLHLIQTTIEKLETE